MADFDPEPPDGDPWLTLAEIAGELRMSPATIRSWISQGTLRAMRPGKRKLLVRRSELDRMLAGEDMAEPHNPPGKPDWREHDTIAPPGRSPHWPDEAVKHVTRKGWLWLAESEWRDALRASAMAPPDVEFGRRVRGIADAAARKAAALANLEDEPAGWWRRQSGVSNGMLSHELRPDGNRPGPAALWARADTAVERLSGAMESHSAPAEQHALEQLSLVLHEIVDALADRSIYPWPEDWEGETDEVDNGSSGGGESVE